MIVWRAEQPLVLASASPRRADLLRALGVPFEVRPAAGVVETPLPGEAPRAFALRMAREKAEAVAVQLPGRWVLGADTVVTRDGIVYGKPEDDAHAKAILRALSGGVHEVCTGVALLGPNGMRELDVVTSEVDFVPLSEADIDTYVATGEPRDKAGAYAVQGIGGKFVAAVRYSRDNVIGLPTEWLMVALTRQGLVK